MNRLAAFTVSVGAFALATAAVAMPSTVGAQTPPEGTPTARAAATPKAKGLLERARNHPKPAEIAIAFGRIEGDEAAVIDFRAAEGAERSGGHLRFWTEDDGFYNGVSRKVEIDGQKVHAEGAGPLTKPDGTRVRVRFTLDLDGATRALRVTVKGEGVDYTLEGTVEGRVFVGAPPKAAS